MTRHNAPRGQTKSQAGNDTHAVASQFLGSFNHINISSASRGRTNQNQYQYQYQCAYQWRIKQDGRRKEREQKERKQKALALKLINCPAGFMARSLPSAAMIFQCLHKAETHTQTHTHTCLGKYVCGWGKRRSSGSARPLRVCGKLFLGMTLQMVTYALLKTFYTSHAPMATSPTALHPSLTPVGGLYFDEISEARNSIMDLTATFCRLSPRRPPCHAHI